MTGWQRMPDSLFSRTLILVLATVLLSTLLNVGIILLRPPPFQAPVTAYEVSRLLKGEPLAKAGLKFTLERTHSPPPVEAAEQGRRYFTRALATFLEVPVDRVRIQRSGRDPLAPRDMEKLIEREFHLYGRDGQYNPLIIGRFRAAVQLRDGSWREVATNRDPLSNWQLNTALRLLPSLLIVVPFAWLFSKKLARPIRAFACAAERLGRRQEVELVEVEGPSEIRQAAVAVNEMQTRLKRYIAERTSVVGAIAHDLRTPLSRLNFHLAAAPEPVRAKGEAEIAEMETMITATLDFVENEARPRVRDKVDLALLIEGVVDDLADLGRDVRLTGTEPTTIEGDPLLLKRLFANLINNAVTYGRRAEVSLTVEPHWAVVEIGDEGPGLSESDLERVFEPFYRAETSRNRSTGGMGLGLAIVRAAAGAHGGEVRLSNRDQGGLCAQVRLPINH